MKVKLKTWEQLKRELEPIAIKWEENTDYNNFNVVVEIYEDLKWIFDKNGFLLFGKEIEVERLGYSHHFTHRGSGNEYGHLLFHKMWFEPEFEDFLKEKDFEI